MQKNHAMENRVKENHVRRGIPVVIVLVIHVSTLIVAVPTFLMDLSWGILRETLPMEVKLASCIPELLYLHTVGFFPKKNLIFKT